MNLDALLSRLLILAVIGGLLPLGAAYWWGFELFAHFRVQYIGLAAFLFIVAIAFRKRLPALLLAATAAFNAWPLWPYLPAATAPQDGFRFEVLNVNVNSDNGDHAAIIDAIRTADTDLVFVLELTPILNTALESLAESYPYRFAAPADDNFGIGILSRYPLNTPTELSIGPTTAIDSLVELPAGSLRFVVAHLVPPTGADLARARNTQLTELAEHASRIDAPLLVCGDFNLTPYSPFFGRFAEEASLSDVRLGRGLGLSWPSFMPLFGIPIDHCLIRGPIEVISVERLNPVGSDHYPVRVTLVWQGNE